MQECVYDEQAITFKLSITCDREMLSYHVCENECNVLRSFFHWLSWQGMKFGRFGILPV